ncbi:MAG: flavodoxin family protein [Deltaproteobacteria bacterium]|nr:flavodoxin family protein [Deltaproteobacteria bacterium]
MKVLAINSSPRGKDQSKTELLLDSLVEGMRSADADVEVVHLRAKKINYCIGCYTCWTKTPGQCVFKDDMTRELLPKFLESDLAIFATPLYHFGVNAQLKTFIERTLPAIEPFLIEHNGKTSHPMRGRHPLMVALSVAGFPEYSIFDQMSSQLRQIYKRALVAEIYRPASETLVQPAFEKVRVDILDAVKQAGVEIVQNLKVSDDTMKRIVQPVIDLKTMCAGANMLWQTYIDAGVTPKEAMEKK